MASILLERTYVVTKFFELDAKQQEVIIFGEYQEM